MRRRIRKWRARLARLRQRFILTVEEKRVILFVLVAFSLGLIVKHYREIHPQPIVNADQNHPLSRNASPDSQKRHKSSFKKTGRKTPRPRATILPERSPGDHDDQG